MIIIFGVDLSVNHYGIVTFVINDGKECVPWGCEYATNENKFFKLSADKEKMLPHNCNKVFVDKYDKKKDDRDCYRGWRRAYVIYNLIAYIDMTVRNIAKSSLTAVSACKAYVCLEDYFFSQRSPDSVQVIEMSGILRDHCFRKGYLLRLHDPSSLKLFATDKGNATKRDVMEAAISSGFGGLVNSREILGKEVKKGKDRTIIDTDGPVSDLADAFILAEMLRVELVVRQGHKSLQQLPSGQRRIFLRIPKNSYNNLLDRPFIQDEKKD